LNTGQCARLLGLDESTIVKACKKGDLYPARFAQGHRSRWVITRADAERYGRNLRERQIVDLLETGASAIEVYRRIPALDAGELAKAIDVWAKLTGTWVSSASGCCRFGRAPCVA
jgi:hypothetical protein